MRAPLPPTNGRGKGDQSRTCPRGYSPADGASPAEGVPPARSGLQIAGSRLRPLLSRRAAESGDFLPGRGRGQSGAGSRGRCLPRPEVGQWGRDGAGSAAHGSAAQHERRPAPSPRCFGLEFRPGSAFCRPAAERRGKAKPNSPNKILWSRVSPACHRESLISSSHESFSKINLGKRTGSEAPWHRAIRPLSRAGVSC